MPNQQTHTSLQETQPLVSFIITYYQMPVQMLQECLDSILQLSLRSFEREIIIIDDGSEKSPINELGAYEDDIIYVRQKNGGVSAARNKGLDIAKGTFIQFVDADDILIQAPYEQCLDIVRYQENVDMVMFNFSTNWHSNVTPESVTPVNGSYFLRNNNIHGAAWGYLFNKAILGELRFTPSIQYGEDEEFTALLILRAEKLYATNYQAYFYRKHQSSVTSQTDSAHIQKRLDDSYTIITKLNTLTDKMAHTDKLALQRRIAQLTMDYIYNIIVKTKSKKELDQRIQQLYDNGLFPLPEGKYTSQYTWFQRIVNNSMGRSILLHTLPLLKKER